MPQHNHGKATRGTKQPCPAVCEAKTRAVPGPPSPTLQAKPCLLTGQPTLFSPPSHSRLTTLKARGHLELLKEPQRKPNAPRSLPPPTLILTTFFPGTSLLLNVKDDNSFPSLALYAPFLLFYSSLAAADSLIRVAPT